MPAKRAIIIPKYQPIVASYDEQVNLLAQASAILAKGAARRIQTQPTQSKVEISTEFIHNAPLIQGSLAKP